MVGSLLALTAWTKLSSLIEFKKFPMKDQCVICYGQTLMNDVAGVFLREGLATLLVKIFLSNLIILMDSNLYAGHINWS